MLSVVLNRTTCLLTEPAAVCGAENAAETLQSTELIFYSSFEERLLVLTK